MVSFILRVIQIKVRSFCTVMFPSSNTLRFSKFVVMSIKLFLLNKLISSINYFNIIRRITSFLNFKIFLQFNRYIYDSLTMKYKRKRKQALFQDNCYIKIDDHFLIGLPA